MKCSKCKRLVSAYLDRELGEAVAREVEAHLAACTGCRAEADAIRRTLNLLEDWQPIEPRLGLDALRERLKQRARPARQPVLPVPRWAAAALAVLSIGVGAALGVRVPQAPPAKAPSEQQVASAVGLPQYDDLIEASMARGINELPAEAEGAAR
jgi:predicted anti-sigma-YlaC factor YlaD